jgi:flagellar biosynthesis protein FlhB
MATGSEPASARKLKRAREFGDTPTSSHLTQALTLGASLCVIPALFVALWTQSGNRLQTALRAATTEGKGIELAVQSALVDLIKLCLPILAVTALAQLVSRAIQSGGFGAKHPSKSSRHRTNLLSGLGRLFTWRALLTQICAVAIAATLMVHALMWIRDHAAAVTATLGDIPTGLQLIVQMTRRQLWFALAAWLCVGCIELAIAYRLWLQQQMMSPEEKRKEQKETEGDPLVLWQRTRIRSQTFAESSNWSVSDGTLLIHDKLRIAAVLHFDAAISSAPRLVAVGAADLAGAMIAEAQRFSIPIVEHEATARVLAGSSVGEQIPEKLYEVVAELMSEIR